MPAFVPGLLLAGRFYREVVRPILDDAHPGLAHSAGLIGFGSEVLGFDTEVSTDHHWGPRALLFLREEDHARHAGAVHETLRSRLPPSFLGWSTHFSEPDPTDNGTQRLEAGISGDINHRVEVHEVRAFFTGYLGLDATAPLTARAWLTLPGQKLLTITGGELFHDGIGLEEVRRRFAWYPHDVWLYLLASGWRRIAQEEHLMGRAAQVGDELGSRIITGRLVRDLMRLGFLMERQHAPYPKWFGTAFARLACAPRLLPPLERALAATGFAGRDQALAEAYGAAARMHNALGLTDPIAPDPGPFFGRPFTVIFGDRFAEALRARISDPEVRALPLDIGSVDQWSDSTDVLEAAALRPRLEALYG